MPGDIHGQRRRAAYGSVSGFCFCALKISFLIGQVLDIITLSAAFYSHSRLPTPQLWHFLLSMFSSVSKQLLFESFPFSPNLLFSKPGIRCSHLGMNFNESVHSSNCLHLKFIPQYQKSRVLNERNVLTEELFVCLATLTNSLNGACLYRIKMVSDQLGNHSLPRRP